MNNQRIENWNLTQLDSSEMEKISGGSFLLKLYYFNWIKAGNIWGE